jgi:hypothetical protein
VRVANDQDFAHFSGRRSIQTTIGANAGGRTTMVHEMGHMLGLGHASGLNMMQSPVARHPVGRGWARPFPDEVLGTKVLYSSKSVTDLFPTVARFTSSGMDDILKSDQVICQGDDFTFRWTVANVSNTSQTFDQRILFDDKPPSPPPPPGSPPPIVVAFWNNGTVSARAHFTWSVQVTFGNNFPPGVYRVFHEVDHNDESNERNEGDNWLEFKGTIEVRDC